MDRCQAEGRICKMLRRESVSRGVLHTATWLSYVAAPAFATMAVLGGVLDDESASICSSNHGGVPLMGMVSMYVLMSIFHLGPWLKVVAKYNRSI